MICRADTLPAAFAATKIPSGPITDAAADAIARLLWARAERDLAAEAEADQAGAKSTEGRS